MDVAALCARLKANPLDVDFLFKKIDVDGFQSCCPSHSSFVSDACLGAVFSAVASLPPPTPSQVTVAAAALKRIIAVHKEHSRPLSAENESKVLSFVHRFWDFSIDVVCHDMVDSFTWLLQLHGVRVGGVSGGVACDDWLRDAALELFDAPSASKGRFRCMLALVRAYPCVSSLGVNDEFRVSLYQHIASPSLAVVVSEMIIWDLSAHKDKWSMHIGHIKSSISSSGGVRVGVRERLLPLILKATTLEGFMDRLMESLQDADLSCERGLEAVVSLARFVLIAQKRCKQYKRWFDFVSWSAMRRALLHSSLQVRLAGWALLCDHPKQTDSVGGEELSLADAFILTNMTEQQPAARQKILAGLKKLLVRLCESAEPLAKERGEGAVLPYVAFLQETTRVAFESLSRDGNVERRVMALLLVDLLFRQDVLRTKQKVLLHRLFCPSRELTAARQSLVVALLDDPFQSCQNSALQLLGEGVQWSEPLELDFFLDESRRQLLSIRAHDSLACGYRLQYYVRVHPDRRTLLIEELTGLLEARLQEIESSLVSITSSATLHPLMNALALLLKGSDVSGDSVFWASFVPRLLPLCLSIAAAVAPVVHSMSPEGFMPDEMIDKAVSSAVSAGSLVRLQSAHSQLLLVCCWRAHKHVSEVLAWAVDQLPFPSLLSHTQLASIGDFFWQQLTECKHCGAFESAVEGFEALCRRLWQINPDGEELGLPSPSKWLREVIGELDGTEEEVRLCATRRSAGLPHLVCAVLGSEPDEREGAATREAMRGLMQMETRTLDNRVHSVNVLRSVVACAGLGERVAAGIEWAVQAAMSKCSSSHWAERNAAAQLAAALRARIFGVTRNSQRDHTVDAKNKMSAFEFFSRYPSLYDLLLFELGRAQSSEFGHFPVLVFLTHIYPTGQTEWPLAPFVPRILGVLLSCRSEKLRKLAAAALVAVSTREDILFLLDWAEPVDLSAVKQNHLYGLLTLLHCMLDARPEDAEVARRVRGIAAEATRQGVPQWCDLNVDCVLCLCLRCGVRVSGLDGVSVGTLAKRPLAEMIDKQADRPSAAQLASQPFRLEMYRQWLLNGVKGEEKEMLRKAVLDLETCTSQRDQKTIMNLLYSVCASLDADTRSVLASKLGEMRREKRLMGAEARSAAWRLAVCVGGWTARGDDLQELLDMAKEDGDNDDMIEVVRAAGRCLPGDGVSDALSLFLQSQDDDIREEAARVLSPTLSHHKSHSLSAAVCWHLVRHTGPAPAGSAPSERAVLNAALFDSWVRNPFAESIEIGGGEKLKEIVDAI